MPDQQPLFDMSKAQPIPSPVAAPSPGGKPLFDMSKAQAIPGAQPPRKVTDFDRSTIGPQQKPEGVGEKFSQWAHNVQNDIKYGTDVTGIGTVLKKMGAHGVYSGNPEAVGDYMASIPLGIAKFAEGTGEMPTHPIRGAMKQIAGGLQAAEIPLSFAAPEVTEGASTQAAETLEKVASLTKPTKQIAHVPTGLYDEGGKMLMREVEVLGKSPASKAAGQVTARAVEAAKGVKDWTKANPIKALALEGVAHELGIDPVQLAAKVVKYGAKLFGDEK